MSNPLSLSRGKKLLTLFIVLAFAIALLTNINPQNANAKNEKQPSHEQPALTPAPTQSTDFTVQPDENSARVRRLEPIQDSSNVQSTCPVVTGQIILYDGTYCSGSNTASANLIRLWVVSPFLPQSIAIPSGWSAMLYSSNDIAGPKVCYAYTDNDLSGDTFSDGTSVANRVFMMYVYNKNACYNDSVVPGLSWTSPVGDNGVYAVGDQNLTLTVSASDNMAVAIVQFSRYDYVTQQFVSLGQDLSDPFSITLNTSALLPGYNQIDATAIDTVGNTTTKSFWLNHNDPVFSKTSPANTASGVATTLSVSWGTSKGATSYDLCLDATNDGLCTTSWTSMGLSTGATISNLSPGATYYWHVRANNAGGITYSNASSTAFWSFTTIPPTITNTPVILPTKTSTPLVIPTQTNTPTKTLTPIIIPTQTSTKTYTPVSNPTITNTPTKTSTPVLIPTYTNTPLGAATVTGTAFPASATFYTAISASANHTCGLTNKGVKCWGYNASGQLGNATTTNSNFPVDVSGLGSNILAISTGWYHSCALTALGGVKCWGSNSFGQLGNGNTTNQPTPVDVSGLTSNVIAISAGGSHTCALTNAGAVLCWGMGSMGQLGNSASANSSSPVAVTGLGSGIKSIAGGGYHTCAITTGGAVKCWGFNNYGELGDGSTSLRNLPVDVPSLTSGVSAITTGEGVTCALLSGAAKCWGSNTYGQLGDGTVSVRYSPVAVSTLPASVSAISTSGYHTCALVSSSDLRCWGRNNNGQLANGTINEVHTPTSAIGLTDPINSLSSTCYTTTTGSARCWGNNVNGQVGDSSNTNRYSPVDVIGSGVPPAVSSITRADTDPATASTVNFTVTFSKLVSGVDLSDFILTSTGLTGMSISGVSGSGASYSVSAASGVGYGSLRLDLKDNDSILDAARNPLGGAGIDNGNYSAGGIYTVNRYPTLTATNTATRTITPTLPASATLPASITPTPTRQLTSTITSTATIAFNPFTPTFTKSPPTATKTITPTAQNLTFTTVSIAVADGWVLESNETSKAGGTKSSIMVFAGDDALNREYRSILSFNTAGIPDNAIISKIVVKIKRNGIFGTNPFTSHGTLLADMVKGSFWTSSALQLEDFQALATKNSVGSFVPVSGVVNWYQLNVNAASLASLNKTGLTQFRIRFSLDDDNDHKADYVTFYPGEAIAANRPMLIVTYKLP